MLSHRSAASSRLLDARDSTHHQGIAITTVPRTVLDLAATVNADRLERALAQAQRLQRYDHSAIQSLLARANGHRGTAALARATARESPKWTRNEFEAWLLRLVRDAGLPEPLVNEPLAADRRRDAALQADGWRVVRFTWHEPTTTIQRRLEALLHH